MNRIVLKKEIKAKYPVEGISLVNLEDEIEYKSSSEGMYATGSIKISGEYYKGVRNSKFLDEIDVDIFAPFDDLSSRNELHVNIIDFDYKINEDMLLFEVILDVDGLKEMNKSFPSEVYEENEEVLPIETIEKVDEVIIVENNEINEDVILDRSGNDNTDLVYEEIKESKDNTIEETKEITTKPIKKDETTVCWSFHVVLNNDTYESIAMDLNIDVNLLKKMNKNKELIEGTLVLIP